MTLPYELPRKIMSDAYGPSPLVTDLSVRRPSLFEMASERADAPTLFATGDLPPFTASGMDPALLHRLPYHWRHAAASNPDGAEVLSWLEKAVQDPEVYGSADDGQPHPGLMDYRARMERWAGGLRAPDVTREDATYPDTYRTPRMQAAAADREAQANA